MTKQQENRAFVKMLKEFPKAFGRVSFRERLMLKTAFTYVVEEVIADIKANFDYVLEGKDLEIKELKMADEYIIKTLESKVEKLQEDLRNKRISIKNKKTEIKELEDHLAEEVELHLHAEEYTKSLEQQIEEMKTIIKKKYCKKCPYRKDNEMFLKIAYDENKKLKEQIEKMKFWHSKTEMEVVRDVLTEYINNHESFDIAIFNVRNRLNGRLNND